MFNKIKTKKSKIKRLKKEGYRDLWVVDNHLTDVVAQASTWIWVIFQSEDKANEWIQNCLSQNYPNIKQEFVISHV